VYSTALSAAQVSNHRTTGTTALTALVRNAPDVRLVSSASNARIVGVGGSTPAATAFDPGLHRLYVTRGGKRAGAGNGVTVIDTRSWRVVGQIATGGSGPSSIAVNPITHRVYVTSAVFDPTGVHGSVKVIDGRTNRVLRSIATGPGPKAIAVNPKTNRVYVTEQTGTDGGQAVAVIEGASNLVIATIPTGRYERYYDNPFGLAVNAGTNTVYVSNPLEGNVYAIDGRTNAVTRSVGVGGEPGAIAINPATNALVVSGARYVTTLGGRSIAVIARTAVGRTRAIAVDASRHAVYATTGRGDVVTIAHGSVRAIARGLKPNGLAVTPETGGIVVADSLRRGVLVIADRARGHALTDS
jgi:YVTN family beta-propeller protein